MQQSLGLGKSSTFGERGFTKRLGTLAKRTDLSGDRLLDIGCGDGAYSLRLAPGFRHVDAIDIQTDRLAMFSDRIAGTPLADQITVRQMSADKLDYADESFDLVTAIEVLEHVTELDQALAEICRVLKPGGRFAFSTPNRWFPFETHGFHFRGKRYPPSRGPFLTWIRPLHRRLARARAFTAGELTERLTRAGLVPQSIDYIMPPFDLSSVGSKIRPVTDFAERTPLRVFGMALVVTAVKPA
ncbi:MAG: class I SAM-dependent methyltransferase [Streptosporangiaceae bacterium]